jgi:hypothetical protein
MAEQKLIGIPEQSVSVPSDEALSGDVMDAEAVNPSARAEESQAVPSTNGNDPVGDASGDGVPDGVEPEQKN